MLPKMGRVMRHQTITLIALVSILGFILSCSPDTASQVETTPADTGSFSFSLKWPESTIMLGSGSPVSRAVDCNSEGIDTIVAAFFDSSSQILNYPPNEFTCSDHSGSVTGLPAGSNYRLLVRGKDASGTVLYEGEETGITIFAGQTTLGG